MKLMSPLVADAAATWKAVVAAYDVASTVVGLRYRRLRILRAGCAGGVDRGFRVDYSAYRCMVHTPAMFCGIGRIGLRERHVAYGSYFNDRS
jgi:hypothetical protein